MASMDTNKTCEERIADQLSMRIGQFRDIFDRIENVPDEDSPDYDPDSRYGDDAQDELYELPLSVDSKRVVTVLLSTGGPADWFEATVDGADCIESIVYVFQDWWDGARRPLTGDEYAMAEQFILSVSPELQ